MKTIAVLAALAAVATAVPTLPGYYNGHGFRSAPYRLPTHVRREKKSTELASDVTFTGEPIPHLKSVPEFEARTFKKPIIVKKKFGYHHLYRDSDEERAASNDPQETCGKEVTVKLCDSERIHRSTGDVKHAADGTTASITDNDMKHSIKLAKEAVENLQKATQFQNIEANQDSEMHEDIEKARQALDHIQRNFGNLESINVQATTLSEAEALQGGRVQVARTEGERMAQWKEAIENIQKNAKIAKNIEDSFKSAQEAESINIAKSSALTAEPLVKKNAQDNTQKKPNVANVAVDEERVKRPNLEVVPSASIPNLLHSVKSKSTENIDLSPAASAPVVQTALLADTQIHNTARLDANEGSVLQKSALLDIKENESIEKSIAPATIDVKMEHAKAADVDTTMLMKSVENNKNVQTTLSPFFNVEKHIETVTDSAKIMEARASPLVEAHLPVLKSSENAQQLESHMPPFFKSSENTQRLESHMQVLKTSENSQQLDSHLPPFFKSSENSLQSNTHVTEIKAVQRPPVFKSTGNGQELETHMPPFFKSSENVQQLNTYVTDMKSAQRPPFFKSSEHGQQLDSHMPPFFKNSEDSQKLESHMPPFFKSSENVQQLNTHVTDMKSAQRPPFFKSSENVQQLNTHVTDMKPAQRPPFFKSSENVQQLNTHVTDMKSAQRPPFFKSSENVQQLNTHVTDMKSAQRPPFFKSSEIAEQQDEHMPPFFKSSENGQQVESHMPPFFKSSENGQQVESHMPPFFKSSENEQKLDAHVTDMKSAQRPPFVKSSENGQQLESHMPPFFKSSEIAKQQDEQKLDTHVTDMKSAQRPPFFKSSETGQQLESHMPPFFKSSEIAKQQDEHMPPFFKSSENEQKLDAHVTNTDMRVPDEKIETAEDKERTTMLHQVSSSMMPVMHQASMISQPMLHGLVRPLHHQPMMNTMFHGKSVDIDSAAAPSTQVDKVSGKAALRQWSQKEEARGAYGLYGASATAAAAAGAAGAGLNLAASAGSGQGAVGVFPGASVGGCAVPLLLSCSPSVVPGTLAHAPAPSYAAPHAYRSASSFDRFHNKRETIKELKTKVKRTPAKVIQNIRLDNKL